MAAKRIKVKPAFVCKYLFVILLVSFSALPLVYVFSTAFKPLDELFIFPPRFFVTNPTLENFSNLFRSLSDSMVPFSRYLFNSIFLSTVIVLGTVLICCMAAFALVKLKPPGSKAFFSVVLAALMFSPHVTQIPRYMIIDSMNLVDTYWAIILPNIAVAYNMFLIKQFCEQVPDSLMESARIDGANDVTLFFKVIMPLLKPAWITLMVNSFISSWNDYFTPLIFLTKPQLKTLPLALQSLGSSISRAGAVAASALIMVVPPIVIFLLMQKSVLQTMIYSGIKE